MTTSKREPPSDPRPPDADIQRVFPDLAQQLSDADFDSKNLRALPVDEVRSRLLALQHSAAAIGWAIHLGIRLEGETRDRF